MDRGHREGGCNGCNAVTGLPLKKKYFDLRQRQRNKSWMLMQNTRYGVTALQKDNLDRGGGGAGIDLGQEIATKRAAC